MLLRHKPVTANRAGDRIRAVTLRDLETGREGTISAPYFLDATEQGDLLPPAGVDYVTGLEGTKETGEPHASAEVQPANVQAFTYCFTMDYLPGEDHRIEKPAEYRSGALTRPFCSLPGRGASELDVDGSDHAGATNSSVRPRVRLAPYRWRIVALWPHRRSPKLRTALICKRHLPGELAAERLFSGKHLRCQ